MKKLCAGTMLLAATGCQQSPAINVDGSFLPAWMLCLLVGTLVAIVANRLIEQRGLEERVAPPLVFYPGLVIAASSLVWLALFR